MTKVTVSEYVTEVRRFELKVEQAAKEKDPQRRLVSKQGLRHAADDILRLAGLVTVAVTAASQLNPMRTPEQMQLSAARRRFDAAVARLNQL